MKLLDPGALRHQAATSLQELEAVSGQTGGALRVAGDADVAPMLERLRDLGSVTVVFGAFRDGRGFSIAARLRAAGFTGELIAAGDLLPDQALYLARCGFDAVELPPGADRGEWEMGLAAFSAAYQPAALAGATIWDLRARRSAPASLAVRVAALNARFRGASAERILDAAIRDEFAGGVALLSSFGAEAAVTLHLVARVDPSVPVLFLDTGRHFAPTLHYRALLIEHLGLTDVRVIAPENPEIEDADGRLWARDPDNCCDLRKVRPLAAVVSGFEALITGRKRMHGGERVRLAPFQVHDGRVRVNPLADWSAQDVEAYFQTQDLPRHPLQQAGYTSIGCWPCTEPTQGRGGDRSGRWAGRDKQECGIHHRLPRSPAAATG